ncbi:MAG: hypothetical protein RL637_1056 [Pseudomonadota bacterium]|jgi:tRNA(adenine34) deaminase
MKNIFEQDQQWMAYALKLAETGQQLGEVPVGAVIVFENQKIAQAWNQPIATNDPTAHAEIVAIRQAGCFLGNYRLLNTTLYVTLEPCLMCIGAIIHSRIQRLVFATTDPKRGAVCSALQLSNLSFLNHQVIWQQGILEIECSQLLQNFFKARR